MRPAFVTLLTRCDPFVLHRGYRGAFSVVSLQRLTPNILKVIQKEAEVSLRFVNLFRFHMRIHCVIT